MTNPRIPMALQQVFVASQSGKEVTDAPRQGMGFKMFSRGFAKKFGGRSSRSRKGSSSVSTAPTMSSLHSDRGGPAKDTAADATRKAMKKKKSPPKVIDIQSPQSFLDNALEERGYSVRKFCSLEGGYYCRPTPLQQASYGCRLSQAVRSSDATLLRRLLDSGLSPNPCNSFGESLVHMICRRGDHKLLRIMLEAGCSLQVTDDYGRTPLHDACWKADPSFETVQLILDADKNLLNLMDCRGSSPLSYVSKDKYPIWIQFLSSKLDRFWPRRDIATEGVQRPPALALRQPHSMPIQDPLNALPLEVAAMVSNGRMEPEEALYLDDSSEDDDSSYDSEDDSIYSDDDDYDSEDEDSEFDQAEMAEICLRAGGPMAIAQRCFGNKATTAAMAMGRGGGPSSTKMA